MSIRIRSNHHIDIIDTRREGEIRVHNKIKSMVIGGKRRPGRPFNTTTYPWRSVAIGRSFHLNPGMEVSQSQLTKLRAEGRNFKVTQTPYGYKVTRTA